MGRAINTAVLTFLLWGIAVPLAVVPLSIYFETGGTAVRVFWWIFWVLGVVLAVVLPVGCGWQMDGVGLWAAGLQYVALPVFIVGWWFLCDGSLSLSVPYRRGMTTAELPALWASGDTGVIVFAPAADGGGVVQEGHTEPGVPLTKTFDFSIGCHGAYTARECCDHKNVCNNCGYYTYPTTCPAYHAVTVTPLWQQATVNAPGAKPVGFVFQHRPRVFDIGEQDAMAADKASVAKQPFTAEYCTADGQKGLCGVDLRNPAVEKLWSEWHERLGGAANFKGGDGYHALLYKDQNVTHFKREGTGVVDFQHRTPSEVMTRARTVANDAGKLFAVDAESMPLVWMPSDGAATFEIFEEKLGHSASRFSAACWMLGTSAPVLVVLFATVFWHMQGDDREGELELSDDQRSETSSFVEQQG